MRTDRLSGFRSVFTRHTALLLLVIVFFSLIRYRLRNMPLERDEGEYAYAGQLLLQGIPPYQLAYNMKLPGTYVAYAAAFALFGESVEAVRYGLMVVNAVTIVLVALLGRRLYGATGGLAAGICYACLSTSPAVLGLSAHATHFVVLAAIAGALLLIDPEEAPMWKIAAAGLCMGAAMVMKQPGAAFIASGAVYLLAKRRRALGVYLAGAAFPFAFTCFLLWRAGVFEHFWFWTVSYSKQYGTIVSLSDGFLLLLGMLPQVAGAAIMLWALAAIGVYQAVRVGRSFFLVSWLLFSFAAVAAGLYFRNHYFVMMLPAVSLLVGASVAASRRQRIIIAIFAAGIGIALFVVRTDLFTLNPLQVSARMYGDNPFPEARQLAAYLREHTPRQARIAVLGSEPEIYFYAQRHSATGYIYTYGLMEPQKYAHEMQEGMIAEIERAQPDYIIYVHSPSSWLRRPASDDRIFTWAGHFLATEYEPVEAPGSPRIETFRRTVTAAAK